MRKKLITVAIISILIIGISSCLTENKKTDITGKNANGSGTGEKNKGKEEGPTSEEEDGYGPTNETPMGAGYKKISVDNEFINNGGYNDWVVETKSQGVPFGIPNPSPEGLIFTVKEGTAQGEVNSLTKIFYKERNRMGYGDYITRFKISRLPTDNTDEQIYFGMGLWEFGGGVQANEVMMGYYLIYNNAEQKWDDRIQVLTRNEGAHSKVSSYDPTLTASAFVNTFHTIEFKYSPDKVVGLFDGKPVLEKTDNIPSVPMSLIIGTRIASGSPLSSDLDVTFQYVKFNAQVLQ